MAQRIRREEVKGMTAFDLASCAFNQQDLKHAEEYIIDAYAEHSIPEQSLWIMPSITGMSKIQRGDRAGAADLLQAEKWLNEQEADEAHMGQVPSPGEQGSRRGFRVLMEGLFD
jgi:hypothetical protein